MGTDHHHRDPNPDPIPYADQDVDGVVDVDVDLDVDPGRFHPAARSVPLHALATRLLVRPRSKRPRVSDFAPLIRILATMRHVQVRSIVSLVSVSVSLLLDGCLEREREGEKERCKDDVTYHMTMTI
jgi:hypothetical protein